jgi:hypothetical protein
LRCRDKELEKLRDGKEKEVYISIFHTEDQIEYNKKGKIISELEPCSLEQSQCKKVLKNNFPNIKVEYSYKYPGPVV